MQVYHWYGPGVLQNYGSGQVMVIAESETAAWHKLINSDVNAFADLFCGGWEGRYDLIEKFGDLEGVKETFLTIDDFHLAVHKPKVYNLDQAPCFIAYGSD